mmetsp:Transcript_32546/g.73156  ORF Transcript_32546/g.73156 Transcript_32546/m.73156 type:complete len:89 (+) Transcript_32546:410-676(+)
MRLHALRIRFLHVDPSPSPSSYLKMRRRSENEDLAPHLFLSDMAQKTNPTMLILSQPRPGSGPLRGAGETRARDTSTCRPVMNFRMQS